MYKRQTKDRVRWSQVFLWMVGVIAVISAAWLIAVNYQPPPTKQFTYADLKLGMSQAEVNYVKGPPTNVMEDDGSKPGRQKMIEHEAARHHGLHWAGEDGRRA